MGVVLAYVGQSENCIWRKLIFEANKKGCLKFKEHNKINEVQVKSIRNKLQFKIVNCEAPAVHTNQVTLSKSETIHSRKIDKRQN